MYVNMYCMPTYVSLCAYEGEKENYLFNLKNEDGFLSLKVTWLIFFIPNETAHT